MKPIISIIIPTLNESKFLLKGIQSFLNRAHESLCLEVIVVDAGSSDGTLKSVSELDIITFTKPEFTLKKYESLNFGIEESKGEYLLFLDADTRLPHHFDLLIRKKLSNPNYVGGAFEFAFSNPDWKLQLIQIANRVRYRFGNVFYGDQAVFCKREAAVRVGGFPKRRLMETAYFCQELMKIGKLSLVKRPVETSPRRFQENGFLKVCWFDFTMWMRFILGFSVDKYGAKYWSSNLKSK